MTYCDEVCGIWLLSWKLQLWILIKNFSPTVGAKPPNFTLFPYKQWHFLSLITATWMKNFMWKIQTYTCLLLFWKRFSNPCVSMNSMSERARNQSRQRRIYTRQRQKTWRESLWFPHTSIIAHSISQEKISEESDVSIWCHRYGPRTELRRCFYTSDADFIILFTALHGMQTRSCDENSVRLSVCPSVKRVNCDKTAERYHHHHHHQRISSRRKS